MSLYKLPELAFLDVETTGLSPHIFNDRICEIAILKLYGDGKTESWQSLINPQRHISPEASAINNITDEMVADAPTFEELKDKISGLIEEAVLVCHNATFDLGFLAFEFQRCGCNLKFLNVIDTLRLARTYFDFPSNSLSSIAQYLGIRVDTKHRALANARTTYKIFSNLMGELSKKEMSFNELFSHSLNQIYQNQ